MKRSVIASVAAVLVTLGVVLTAMALWDDDWRRMGDRDDRHGMFSMMGRPGGDSDWSRTPMRQWMQDAVPTGEEGYLVEMVAHHRDAVTAARELERSDRPRMRELGRSVVESQTAQVEQMEEWLAEWYPDADIADYEPMMSDLTGLTGDRLDRAFLRDMVPHHMMAVMSSQQLLMRGLADHPEVARLAQTIRDEQHREIATMVRWSRAWFGAGWGMGSGMGLGMMW